jgi:hypothetical protein
MFKAGRRNNTGCREEICGRASMKKLYNGVAGVKEAKKNRLAKI